MAEEIDLSKYVDPSLPYLASEQLEMLRKSGAASIQGLSKAGRKKRLEEEEAIKRVVERAKREGTYRGPDWDGM